MHWGPFALRIGAVAVELFVAAILVLSILPLATGGLEVNTPNEASAVSLQDGVLTMGFPLEVYNGGYFDIDDVKVSVALDANGTVLTSTSEAMTVRSGVVNHLDPTFSFDLGDLGPATLASLLFERSEMVLDIDVEGTYALGLVDANVSYRHTLDWEPLVSSLVISPGEPSWEENGTSIDLLMRYSFDASSLLHGMETGMVFTLIGEAGTLGAATAVLEVGHHNEGVVRLTVPSSMTGPQDLRVDLGLLIGGVEAHVDQEYRWEGMA